MIVAVVALIIALGGTSYAAINLPKNSVGPGQIKKTRGVPSMILGIPVPDRVPGVPSPGRSKVTQEFTRPKEEAQAPVAALSPLARTGAIGHVEQPDLVPWRRALIETYFTRLRQPLDPAAASATPGTR